MSQLRPPLGAEVQTEQSAGCWVRARPSPWAPAGHILLSQTTAAAFWLLAAISKGEGRGAAR